MPALLVSHDVGGIGGVGIRLQGLGMKMGLWISKVLDPFFLVLDETAQKMTVLVPLPDICTVAALACVDFVQNHWHDRTCRLRVPHITPHADSRRSSQPTARCTQRRTLTCLTIVVRQCTGAVDTNDTVGHRRYAAPPFWHRATKLLCGRVGRWAGGTISIGRARWWGKLQCNSGLTLA